MSKEKELLNNTILIAISRIFTQVAGFLMLSIYTKFLSSEDYGIADLIISYGSLLLPVLILNIDLAIFRFLIDVRKDKEKQDRIIKNAFGIVSISFIFLLVIFIISSVFFKNSLILFILFYLFSLAFGSLMLQIARGLGKIKLFITFSIAQGVLTIIFNIIFIVALEMKVEGLLLGSALGSFIPTLILAGMIGIHKSIKNSVHDKKVKKDLICYSLPLVPNTISGWVFLVSNRTIITTVISTAANGIYAVSNKFYVIIDNLWKIFSMSWSESASLYIDSEERDSFFSRTANFSFKTFNSLGILMISVIPFVFPILIDDTFSEAMMYIPILIIAGSLNSITGFYDAIYKALKKVKQIMYSTLLAAILNLVMCFALIWSIHIWGAALATLLSFLALAIYRHYDMKKYISIEYERGLFLKIIIIYLIVVILYYLDLSFLFKDSNFYAYWMPKIIGLVFAIICTYILNIELITKVLKTLKNRIRK